MTKAQRETEAEMQREARLTRMGYKQGQIDAFDMILRSIREELAKPECSGRSVLKNTVEAIRIRIDLLNR